MPATDVPIISGDSHIIEPLDLWWERLGSELGDRTPRIITEHEGKTGEFFFTGPGGQVQRVPRQAKEVEEADEDDLRRVGFDPAARLRYMDAQGITAEVMNPTFQLALFSMTDHEVMRATAAAYNSWAIEFCSEDADRLLGVSVLPVEDPDWAAEELRRVRERGLRTAIIPLRVPDGAPPYRDGSYDRLWSTAQDLGVPLTLHIVAGGVPHPMHTHVPGDIPGGMMYIYFEVMYPIANDFVFGGILDRFPGLRIIHSEFEISWIPSFMHKLDIFQDTFAYRIPELPRLEIKASDYLRTRVYHGLVDDPYASLVLDAIGVEQIIWGSDFPHAHSVYDARTGLAKTFPDVSDAALQKMTYGNVAQLLSVA